MLDALGKDCFEVAAAEDERPVEAFAPDGVDCALTDGVGPGCSPGGHDDPGALGSEEGVEGGGELGAAIADEELDLPRLLGELHREVAGLLGDPAGDWVRCDAGDPHETRVVVDEHEDGQQAGKQSCQSRQLRSICRLQRWSLHLVSEDRHLVRSTTTSIARSESLRLTSRMS